MTVYRIVRHVTRNRNKILFISIFLTSCKEKNIDINELREKSLKGDTIAYETLQDIYFENNYEEFLQYSYLLSKKFNYKKAYYDTFEIIYTSKGDDRCIDYNLSCLQDKDKKEAIRNLKKAIQLKYEPAINIFCSYYNINKMHPLPEIYNDKNLKLILDNYSCNSSGLEK